MKHTDEEPWMEPRTRQGRRSARGTKDRRASSPSLLETLLGHLGDRVARSAMNRLRRGAQEAVRWTVFRLILVWTGASLMTGGILLALAAGLKGLEALRCPSWLAYLSTGALAVGVALVALRGVLRPEDAGGRD